MFRSAYADVTPVELPIHDAVRRKLHLRINLPRC